MIWIRRGMDVLISQERLKIQAKLLLSVNGKSYMRHRLAQQQMTLSDLERPFHGSSVPPVWEGRDVNALCIGPIVHTKINTIRIARYLCDS